MPARRVAVKAETPAKAQGERKGSAGAGRKGAAQAQMASAVAEMDADRERVSAEENSIFSVCETSQSNQDSPVSEIGEYELSYLANLYQQTDILSSGCNNADAILPDAIAPLSLSVPTNSTGAHMSLDKSSQPAPTPSTLDGSGETRVGSSQPDTPPRKGPGPQWSGGSEVSSRVPSPIKAGRTTTRKRKAAAAVDVPVASPASRSSKAVACVEVKAEPRDVDTCSGSDRGDSPCPSHSHVSEIFEIRPEDDPLGLFNRDPSTLTPEEQRLVKKQRRLLKNRESAQLSRHRKKMHLNALERQVEALKKEKATLATRVQELADDNDRLRKQLLAGI